MALKRQIPVRFNEATLARLESIAQRSGLTASDLIRRAVEEWLDHVEASGEIHIPLQLAEKPARYGRQKSKTKPE